MATLTDDPREPANIESPPALPSILEKRIDLTGISWYGIGWLAVMLVALLVRAIERVNWPLSSGEAGLAADALSLATGGNLSNQALAHPLVTELNALALFLFGASDGIARLVAILAGLATVALALLLIPWLGRAGALGAAFVIAVSPVMSSASRAVDGGALLSLMSLLFLVACLRQINHPSTGRAVACGVAGGLLLTCGPLGWIALVLVGLAALAMSARASTGSLPLGTAAPASLRSERSSQSAAEVGAFVLGLLVSVVIVSTILFTRPENFAGFLGQSLKELWNLQVKTIGHQWYMTVFVLIVDELMALLLGIYTIWRAARHSGLVDATRRKSIGGLIAWTIAGILLAIFLGGKGSDLYSLAALPLALLGGVGLGALCSEIGWSEFWRGWGIGFIGLVALAAAALASTLSTLTNGPGNAALNWFITLALLLIVILLPLVLGAIWFGHQLSQRKLPLIGLIVAILLAFFAIHTSILLPATDIERPGEPLNVGNTTPDVALVVQTIDRVSADMTAMPTDVRDPTGGHGLSIVLDKSIAQPFAWYFRDYPNLTIVDPSHALEPGQPQVVITLPEDSPKLVPQNQNYHQQTYALTTVAPKALASPDWSSILSGIVNPSQIQNFASYLLDRTMTSAAEPRQFDLAVNNQLAQRIYGGAIPKTQPAGP